MVECKDAKMLNRYIEKYNIRELFSTPNLPFRLYRYDAGEYMNISHSQEQYLKFVVDGKLAVEKMNDDGTAQRLFEEKAFAFFGEAEICGYGFSDHYHEVLETVYCIELPLKPLKEVLWNDLKFMQYLVKRMSGSIYLSTLMMEESGDDISTRLLRYARGCPNQTFSGMEQTAKRLRCSRRQLQRVVSQMVEEGKLEKIGWGTYRIVDL